MLAGATDWVGQRSIQHTVRYSRLSAAPSANFLALIPRISGYLSPIGASPSLTDLAACRPLCPSRLYEEIFGREATLATLQRATAAQTHKLPFG